MNTKLFSYVLAITCFLVMTGISHAQEHPRGSLIQYENWKWEPPEGFQPLDPAQFGGEFLWGNLEIQFRIDHVGPNCFMGVFQSTGVGAARVVLDRTEHATVNYGVALIEDEDGEHWYGPGDSFFVRAGTEITVTHYTPFQTNELRCLDPE